MTLEPMLFSARRDLVRPLAGPGGDRESRVAAVIVDWESRDKERRQAQAEIRIGISTQIGPDSERDLVEVVELSAVPVICRVNRWGPGSTEEIERAISCGASEILLPMVRTVEETRQALDTVGDRAGLGIMVETDDAVRRACRLAQLPLRRAYVGLIDLALDRGSVSIFDGISDGTVERLRAQLDLPFGCAGLTLPGCGRPVPARLLAGELVRIGCDFTFLRRSFIADAGAEPGKGILSIRRMLRQLASRGEAQTESDRRDFEAFLRRAKR